MESLEFLKYENEMLNQHKGELLERTWTLEREVSRLNEKLDNLRDLIENELSELTIDDSVTAYHGMSKEDNIKFKLYMSILEELE